VKLVGLPKILTRGLLGLPERLLLVRFAEV